ncbi:HAD family hydrolase [Campylobacter pinnipediorum]|uniref:phosphoglycolate phosphatase n=1 Tax=Campylobacter pinnipediorum subsp. pinnipediorum TaxID=1660067 RepID=A0AAX0L8R0_9BACT|nr:HAD family hydrolase [Campylobacter pinnipediorum]AQW82365.1 HAD-superfamily hydrolase, subfamily IA, probable phosphoglycolate phosphatase [Campylobacter pinnipediorum subsp. pinnipediorum]OPA74414.1 hypothetical protein BFG04_06735 [Campylobacter pinnipediorum subsp. pinnipediorum]
MKKTILFDLDGTLIDSTPAILESFKVAFDFYGEMKLDEEKAKSLIGYTLEDIFLGLGVKQDMVQNYFNVYRDHYKNVYLPKTTLLPYAKQAVMKAYEFADLGVVTTKSSKFLSPLLNNLEIGKYFAVFVGRNDVVNPKPSAEPVELALTKLNKNSPEYKKISFMVGDTPLDTGAAVNAGVIPLSLTCGYSTYEILSQTNDKIFNNPLEAVLFAEKF